MGERRGHPAAGWVIGLTALVGTLVLAVLSWVVFTFGVVANGCMAPGPCAPPSHPYVWGGVLCAVLAGGCFVGGLWLAWRVGSGRWRLRRRPRPVLTSTPASAGPAVFVPCPGCGREVNREVACCPYCEVQVQGGGDG